jgi:ElaB/YqjD/DUF883 family membrane-anchored ribosome-binding protein
MATAQAEQAIPTSARDRVVDAVGRAAHVAHDARVLKTLAADALEDGVHAAKRAAKHGAREIEEAWETAAYRIKKAPFLSVSIAVGAGLLLGIVCGRWGRCASPQKQ